MPDRRTYGFNRDDATELVNSIGSRESWYPEIRPRATGGGSQRIWFTIISVECVSETEIILTVLPTHYTGGCSATIPGQDSYGYVEVEDVCGTLAYYTKDFLESGVTGSATLMYQREGYCEPLWLVDSICGSPECA
jgi:hypothetical protein